MKKRKSLLSIIMRSMIALAVLQIVVFVSILVAGGSFSSVRSYSYSTIQEKTENRKNYIENLLNHKTDLVYETAVEVNGITGRVLEQAGLTAERIGEDKELDRRILSECTDSLVSLLRRDTVNDVFLILNSASLYDEGGRQYRTGLYLRDTDVKENSLSDNKDIFMEMGSSEIAREFGFPLDSGWSLYLDVTDRADRDFFFTPIQTYGRARETPLYNLGYWSGVSSLSDSQQGSLKYVLPLAADDGTVYGVIGVGLLEKSIKQELPVSDLLKKDACFILAADFSGGEEYQPLLYTGAFFRRLSAGDIVTEPVRTVGYNQYEFTSESGLECLGNVQPLNLYNSGSPYRGQQWALISVADKYETLSLYYAQLRTVLVSVVLTSLVCVLSAVVAGRSLSLPVSRMVDKLKESQRSSAPVEFQMSGILEVDALADAVTDLQTQIAKAKDDEYTAKLLEANAALRDAYAVAQRANSAKTDFLSRMSHDIRTPMNAIIGMTAIAEQNLENPEKMADCIQKISVSSHYLLGLINEVLDMSKIESGKFVLAQEPFNLVELVNDLTEMVMPSIKEKNHALKIDLRPMAHENVLGDSMRIQQIFLNMMSNAIKYTPPGGHICVTVSERDVGQELVGCYEFVFEDDGIGMSPEFLQKAFSPFERAEDSRVSRQQGTGLGLAIVDNIVKMMDGSIQAESKAGEGTKFTLTLCLRLSETARQPQPQPLPEDARTDFSGARVLLVDDNELNREIASELLGMAGLEVETAEDGRQAVERFSASEPGYYDMIFMDIQMPIMNGYEASVIIRGLSRRDAQSIPIVAMTANAFAEDIQNARDSGMNEHLAKPIDMDKLYESLRRWIGSAGRQER